MRHHARDTFREERRFGVVGMPLIFSGVAAGFGYPLAWGLAGLLLVGVTLPLLMLRDEAGT